MNILKQVSHLLLLLITTSIGFANQSFTDLDIKDPVTIELFTEHESVKAALTEVKFVLLKEKFIAENGIGESGFTAKRTTGSEADYYIADVMAEKENGKIKITITFVKVGTGMKSMKKLAKKIKEKLEA